jgi:trans-aconitate methyltransferase
MNSDGPKDHVPTQREHDSATTVAALLDYQTIGRYWSKAKPSIMGPYMMDDFGFPASAGSYRFDAERAVVDRLIRSASVDFDGTVLDLGSGVGYWAEYFAQRFKKAIAVEASIPLYEAMKDRCSRYENTILLNDDVLAFEPADRYSLIFLGGMLMYLNEGDVVALLERVTSFLEPGGIVLCRESTVRNGTLTRQGDYQVVYRSVQTYSSLFGKCGLSVDHVEPNTPYFLMQMGCELIKKWRASVPEPLQALPLIGGLVYAALRLGGAPLTRLPDAMGVDFPELTNHFFVLQKRPGTRPSSALSS